MQKPYISQVNTRDKPSCWMTWSVMSTTNQVVFSTTIKSLAEVYFEENYEKLLKRNGPGGAGIIVRR